MINRRAASIHRPPGPRLPPGPLTRLVGREEDVGRVLGFLRSGPLVTLTGAGGIGKSRLARAVAERAVRGRHKQILWLPVARISRPEDVVLELARIAGAGLAARASLDLLVSDLEHREGLIVLDDCEHVVEAVAHATAAILERCNGLIFLTTSREPLRIPGEVTWPVPPLTLPPEDAVSESDLTGSAAATLFLERAAEAKPGLDAGVHAASAVARICRTLDGIPLALELAASRLRVLTAQQLAERLEGSLDLLAGGSRNDLPRKRTMRAAISWSYDLLGPGERWLFARMSVFRGSWTLEAAEAVGGDRDLAEDHGPATAQDDVLAGLSGLVERSMVQVFQSNGTSRYGILEPLRLFAREMLVKDGPAEEGRVRERHARHYAARVREATPAIDGREFDPRFVHLLTVEQDNIREALEWAEREDQVLAAELAADLGWYWITMGLWVEGSERIERILATLPEGADNRSRARALSTAASLAYLLGDTNRVRERSSAALAAWRTVDAPSETARALALLSCVEADAGNAELALSTMRDAFHLAETLALDGLFPWLLACRASVLRSLGRLEEADENYLEAARRAGSASSSNAWVLEAPQARIMAALAEDDASRAALHARTAVQFSRITESGWLRSRTLLACAGLAARTGADATAALLLGAVDSLNVQGSSLLPHEERMRQDIRLQLEERLGVAAFEDVRAEGASLMLTETFDRAELYLLERTGQDAHTARGAAHLGLIRPPLDSSTVSAASDCTLEVLALGPLETYRNGTPVSDAVWRYARPRELLLYLLCHPRGRTREQVGTALWPDASSEQLRNNFHVALHRLRRVLGASDSVVAEQGRYRLNPGITLLFDADRFERGLTDFLRFAMADRTPEEMDELRAHLALYRGEFLESENMGDWHLDRRDHLRQLYVDGQSALGWWCLDRESWVEASEALRKVVQVDDLREDAYRGLMICRAQNGDRAGAQRLYQRLEELLRVELDSKPEPETIELADRLRLGQEFE